MGEFYIIIKWNGKEYEIRDVVETDKIADLKNAVEKRTGVLASRQKILGLKNKGKQAADEDTLEQCHVKPGTKVLMMGSLEDTIREINTVPDGLPDVVNDFDIEEEVVLIENRQEYVNKVARRAKEYKIRLRHEPRPGKKLLVLDIDYTIFDHRSTAQHAYELMRPFLHEFLTESYRYYDIAIWSATSMKWIEVKMKELGVANHLDYKVAFYIDSGAMISIHTPKYGVVEVKPLGVIWNQLPQYSSKNTIMFDDLRRNFLMNPQNGLRIRPFKNAHTNRAVDTELLRLSKYLGSIAQDEDLSNLDHKNWERHLEHNERRRSR